MGRVGGLSIGTHKVNRLPIPKITTTVRVRYSETDQMGVVYYSQYLEYFEVGRNEFFRAVELPYTSLEERGIILPVVECCCQYLNPARYDDLLTIETFLTELKGASLIMQYQIRREADDAIIVAGFTRHGMVAPNGRPIRCPSDVRDHLVPLISPSSQITFPVPLTE